VLAIGLFIMKIPFNFADIHLICVTSCINSGRLTLDEVHELQHLGLSMDFYAAFGITGSLIFELGCVVTGVVIFWRKSNERMALITSFTLVMFGASFNFDPAPILTPPPVLHILSPWMAFLGSICLGLFCTMFPTGRFAPRWVRWLAVCWIVYWGFKDLVQASFVTTSGLDAVVFLGLLISVIAVQVYRYRRVSTPAQRQQTKWVVFGLAAGIAPVALLISFFSTTPNFHPGVIVEMILGGSLYLFLFLIPLSIGIAIMRSGLFDIDVLINRTLVYGLLTGILALTYFGLILGLQALFARITGQASQSPLIIVGSTLVIAALFQPLRHRIQNIIDRRFYRRKYDARRTVANFSATLRGEVDLAQLSEQSVSVVEDTMQPAHVSLWLNEPHQSQPGYYQQEDLPFSQTS
jgi:hypothetical protein